MSVRPIVAPLALCLALSLVACGGGDAAPATGTPAVSPVPSPFPSPSPSPTPAPPAALAVSSIAPNHGEAGIMVTISGAGFSPVAADNGVSLNNMRCEVRSATATELTVIVPPNAGSGNFEVAVASQQARSRTFTYEINAVTVTTLAGDQLGYLDAVGTSARFNGPSGLAFDATGTLFVSDGVNERIRSVSAGGTVNTFAGSGIEGLKDGAGTGPTTGAQFRFPEGLAFDFAGNLFVADWGNNVIRKITPAGQVSTFVDVGAGLSGPAGLAFGNGGDLYVADQGHHRILKVSPNGAVTTFAGGSPGSTDGMGEAAQFQFPAGLAICSDGNLFVADQENNEIRRITPAGEVSTYAGGTAGLGFVDGTLSEARFLAPRGLACDSAGKLFVADTGNERIRMITPSGIVSTLASSTAPGFADGDGAAARFSLPQHIAIAADGSLLVSDGANQRIRKIVWR